MSAQVTRRCFLKQSGSSLFAASFGPAFSAERNGLQRPPGTGKNWLVSSGGTPLTPTEYGDQPAGSEPLERVTYVCGRGEIENYFRTTPKPQNYEQNLETNCQLRARVPYTAIQELESYISAAEPHSSGREVRETLMRARYVLGQIYSFLGNMRKAIQHFQADYDLAVSLGVKDQAAALEKILGIVRFRRGQVENWVAHHNAQSSIFPLGPEARFTTVTDAEEAITGFLECLNRDPSDLEAKWFLNLTCMAVGKHPESVPKKHLMPVTAFESRENIGRFVDVAPALGVDVFAMAGSVIMDDFDNDGFLDLMVSTGDHCESLRYFHNHGDGTFEDRTSAGASASCSAVSACSKRITTMTAGWTSMSCGARGRRRYDTRC